MPSSWSSLTPLLSIKRAFSSHPSKRNKKGRSSPSPPPISSPLPINLTSPPPSSFTQHIRFSRRDEQLRTRKYVNAPSSTPQTSIPPTVPPRRSHSPSPLLPSRRTITPTQQWPSPSTLLEWMEPSLTENEKGRKRERTLSEGTMRSPSRSSFYTSDSIPLPTRVVSREEIDRRGRGTTERVAAWIRSKSRERVDQGEWKRTASERWIKRLPSVSSRSRSIDNLSYSMPAAAGCTNCMTKYTLLNREEGCSGCALSFCKRCVQWRAIIPALSPKPLSVCRACFDRLEKEKEGKRITATVTSTPLYPSMPSSASSTQSASYFASRPQSTPLAPSTHYSTPLPPQAAPHYTTPDPSSSSSIYPSSLSRPWWNEADLPPPSMRSEYGRGVVQARPLAPGMPVLSSGPAYPSNPPQSSSSSSAAAVVPPPPAGDELSEMEERAKKLRDNADVPPPSLCSLEERLAALRGVDVEAVRNPRVFLERREKREEDTVERIMEEAKSRARLEEQNDPDRLLEERANKLMERKEEGKKGEDKEGEMDDEENRLSVAPSAGSRNSEFSEATKEELADIERVMGEAKRRVEETEGRVEREMRKDEGRGGEVEKGMRENNRLAAQLSLDVAKVNEEMAAFWTKENGKRAKDREKRESSEEDELDEETLASIVREAEMAPDEEEVAEKRTVRPAESSPEKKKGIFGRMFKK